MTLIYVTFASAHTGVPIVSTSYDEVPAERHHSKVTMWQNLTDLAL